jgi:hypothetical protein
MKRNQAPRILEMPEPVTINLVVVRTVEAKRAVVKRAAVRTAGEKMEAVNKEAVNKEVEMQTSVWPFLNGLTGDLTLVTSMDALLC